MPLFRGAPANPGRDHPADPTSISMNITVERLPDCKAAIRVEVPSDAVKSQREKITRSFLSAASIPGFRPGKAPLAIVARRYGRQIEDELKEQLIGEGYREGRDKDGLEVIAPTDVKEPRFHVDGRFTFTVEVITAPEFELPDYRRIPLKVPKTAIADQHVEQAVQSLRERFAEYSVVTGRAVEADDVAVIDYHGFIDGKPLREMGEAIPGEIYHAHDYWLRVREPNFLPGFAGGVTGMNIGETRQVPVRFPEDFFVKEIAGMEAVYEVELKEIKQQNLPELDDEFARRTGITDDVASLSPAIRERLEADFAKRLDEMMREQVVNHLNARVNFDLPPEMIDSAQRRRVQELVQENQRRGISENDIIEHREEILSAAGRQAQFDVKTNFILARIAEKESLSASANEVRDEIEEQTRMLGRSRAQAAKLLDDPNVVRNMRERLTNQKTIRFLIENASIEEVEIPPSADGEAVP